MMHSINYQELLVDTKNLYTPTYTDQQAELLMAFQFPSLPYP